MRDADALLTLPDVARRLNVSLRTVRRELADGKLRATRLGRGIRITVESLEQYLSQVLEIREVVPRKQSASMKVQAPWISVPIDTDRIIAAAKPYLEACGIYFLTEAHEIVYVGQSTNVYARVAQHRVDGKPFDGWCFLQADESALQQLERIFIASLQPKLNIALPSDQRRSTPEELQQAVARLGSLRSPEDHVIE